MALRGRPVGEAADLNDVLDGDDGDSWSFDAANMDDNSALGGRQFVGRVSKGKVERIQRSAPALKRESVRVVTTAAPALTQRRSKKEEKPKPPPRVFRASAPSWAFTKKADNKTDAG